METPQAKSRTVIKIYQEDYDMLTDVSQRERRNRLEQLTVILRDFWARLEKGDKTPLQTPKKMPRKTRAQVSTAEDATLR